MFGLAIAPKNGDEVRRTAFAGRLALALDGESESSAARTAMDEPSSTESPLNSLRTCTSCESPIPDAEFRGLSEHSASPAYAVEREPDKFLNPNGNRIEQACKSVADLLVGAATHAAEDLRRQAASDRAKLEATAESTSRISLEIDQVRTALALLSPRVESLAQGEAELCRKLAALDDRFRPEEELSQHAQELMDKFLIAQEEGNQRLLACTLSTSDLQARALASGERLDALSGGVQAQVEANVRLASLCAKLEARLASQEQTIQALTAELRQRGRLVERLLGMWRSLDLRGEARFSSDKAVKVVLCGEQEAVVDGRIVDGSENGLGLLVEAPTPVGSEVRIDVDGTVLSGQVVHCRPQRDGYAVGLRLAAPLPRE